ncbi:hypothetical protein LWC34_05935 [Kibdelosporangium philippinense]|uniref:YvlB/LiaX N-terminal domain-containing protein n=1 Tax=Kibdelosporangium philippinense TaxID=211113 RepID=A0ABS8Z721_9PSEU|nr:hypothetical protein [Kibdelosporangium philippinense]MCE7002373.1 hypothetical protein [Kibdelosporangium philippinense]
MTERKDVLELLAEGKITADEAERLIGALERVQPAVVPDVRPKGKAKYLRLVVDTQDAGERTKVNIRVPLQLLRAGVKLAALIPPVAVDKVNAELTKAGVPFDLGQLKPEQLEELVDHLDDLTLDVDQPDTTVRIFCE